MLLDHPSSKPEEIGRRPTLIRKGVLGESMKRADAASSQFGDDYVHPTQVECDEGDDDQIPLWRQKELERKQSDTIEEQAQLQKTDAGKRFSKTRAGQRGSKKFEKEQKKKTDAAALLGMVDHLDIKVGDEEPAAAKVADDVSRMPVEDLAEATIAPAPQSGHEQTKANAERKAREQDKAIEDEQRRQEDIERNAREQHEIAAAKRAAADAAAVEAQAAADAADAAKKAADAQVASDAQAAEEAAAAETAAAEAKSEADARAAQEAAAAAKAAAEAEAARVAEDEQAAADAAAAEEAAASEAAADAQAAADVAAAEEAVAAEKAAAAEAEAARVIEDEKAAADAQAAADATAAEEAAAAEKAAAETKAAANARAAEEAVAAAKAAAEAEAAHVAEEEKAADAAANAKQMSLNVGAAEVDGMLPAMRTFFQALNNGDDVHGILSSGELGVRIAKKRLSYEILPSLVKELNEAGDDRLHPDEILDNVGVDDDGFVSVHELCNHMSATMKEIRPDIAEESEEEDNESNQDGAAEFDAPDDESAMLAAMDGRMSLADLELGDVQDSPSIEPANADHMSRVECMKVLMKAKLPFQECNRDLDLLRDMVEEYHLVIPDPNAPAKDQPPAPVAPDPAPATADLEPRMHGSRLSIVPEASAPATPDPEPDAADHPSAAPAAPDPEPVVVADPKLLAKALLATKGEFARIHTLCRAFDSKIKPPQLDEELPKNVRTTRSADGSTIYVVHKKSVAQLAYPAAGRRSSVSKMPPRLKLPKAPGGGTYCYLDPQPAGLPPDCVKLLLVDAVAQGSVQVAYLTPATGELTETHPLDTSVAALPDFWEQGTWYDMRMDKKPFWMNTVTRKITLDDPSQVAFPKGSAGLTTLCYGHAGQQHLAGDTVTWKIAKAKANSVAYAALDRMKPTQDTLPPEVWNKKLNRHLDVMPTAHSRVTVGTLEEPIDGQYVNANFIRGFNDDRREYIGCMGPKSTTVSNFWRMINEQKVPIIVMVTKLREQKKGEKEKEKCFEYFPAVVGGTLEFGCRIEMTSSVKHAGFLHSVLAVTTHVGAPPREVHHLWYNTWPDHGVPLKNKKPNTINVLKMLEKIEVMRHRMRQQQCGELGPTVVHCSAGVGRTGTIIAIDHARNLLRHTGKVDPQSIVKSIRQDRCALVQHLNQFEFLNAACSRYAKTVGRTMTAVGQETRLPTLLETHAMLEKEVASKMGKVAANASEDV